LFIWKKKRGTLDWGSTTRPIFSDADSGGSAGCAAPGYAAPKVTAAQILTISRRPAERTN
jgi:hypothetical protein